MFNSSKRSRVESHLEESDEAPRKTRVVRDEVVSFDDGNIDITAGVTSFRVHRGVLSVHSEVFSDMLSMPQPEGSVTSDGCPCVEVTDSADDLRELLLVLYHRHPDFRPGGTVGFKVISSLIRLAHKYQIARVLTEAVGYIKPLYPEDVHQFIEVLNSYDPEPPLRHAPADCIEVIELARLIGDPSLLPPAFYRCCQLPPSLLLGRPKTGSEVQSLPRRLSDEDLERCMLGERRLAHVVVHVRRDALKDPAINCTGAEGACQGALDYIISDMDEPQGLFATMPLCSVFTRMDDDTIWSDMGLCTECGHAINAKELEAQERIWDFLPTYFSLKT